MDKLFGLDTPVAEKELALVRTLYDDISAGMAKEALADEQIPFVAKDRGTGGVMRILTGFSMYGVDFFVRAADLERASELFNALFAQNAFATDMAVDYDAPEDEDVDDGDVEDADDCDCDEGDL